jgi:hypothetical protein
MAGMETVSDQPYMYIMIVRIRMVNMYFIQVMGWVSAGWRMVLELWTR